MDKEAETIINQDQRPEMEETSMALISSRAVIAAQKLGLDPNLLQVEVYCTGNDK